MVFVRPKPFHKNEIQKYMLQVTIGTEGGESKHMTFEGRLPCIPIVFFKNYSVRKAPAQNNYSCDVERPDEIDDKINGLCCPGIVIIQPVKKQRNKGS